MVKKNNEDMAGSVSEPKGAIPEVKPARSLWPRPYENVRVEPVLDGVGEKAPPVAPPSLEPAFEPVADFSAAPEEGYRAPEPRIDFEDDRTPEISAPEVSAPEVSAHQVSAPEVSAPEYPVEPERAPEFGEERPVMEEAPQPEQPREEPVAAASAHEEHRDEPVTAPEPEPVYVPRREERHIREDRHVSVLDAAARQKPALDDAREGRAGRFVAMAAGIVVALALGSVAFVYGAGALGVKFGGGDSDTTGSASAPPTTPAVDAAELKAMQDRVAELEAELDKLRQEKSAAAPASTPENEPANPSGGANPPAEQAAASQPEPGPVASIPGPTPAPGAVNDAPPAPTPAAPPPQAVAPAPSSEPTPKASTSNTAPPTEAARTEPTPAPPPPTPKPKPSTSVARSEPAPPPPPPPSYRPQPSYENGRGASPEMPVLQNWAVRDVYNGIAVVQGGRGAPLEVEPGDELPGGNRVLAIRRLGGSWAVITERGIIAGY